MDLKKGQEETRLTRPIEAHTAPDPLAEPGLWGSRAEAGLIRSDSHTKIDPGLCQDFWDFFRRCGLSPGSEHVDG